MARDSHALRQSLFKQRSWSPDMGREEVWLRRKRSNSGGKSHLQRSKSVTDDDVDELKGCIELGFGFESPEPADHHHRLSDTLPALGFYYAVNKHYADSLSESSGSPPHAIFDPGSYQLNSSINLIDFVWRDSDLGVCVCVFVWGKKMTHRRRWKRGWGNGLKWSLAPSSKPPIDRIISLIVYYLCYCEWMWNIKIPSLSIQLLCFSIIIIDDDIPLPEEFDFWFWWCCHFVLYFGVWVWIWNVFAKVEEWKHRNSINLFLSCLVW